MKRLALLTTAALTFVQPAYAMSKSDEAALLLAISYCLNKDSGMSTQTIATATAQVAIQRGIPAYLVTSQANVDRASELVEVIGCRRLLNR